MKIYPLQPNKIVRPATGFRAPAHNLDFGVEQDFEQWLLQSDYVTDSPAQADWCYLPIYYNRFYCNHWGENWELIQAEILRLVSRNTPTFTICEYDLKSFYPDVDLCNMTVFCASRQADNGSIDIPLLCSAHQELPYKTERKWLASFMGKFETHGIREEMRQALQGRDDVHLSESKDTQAYIELMADSYIALAPRGYGGQSFRFYEAMQFGCVPMLIGDLDTRPFKRCLDWGNSFFTANACKLNEYLTWINRNYFLDEIGKTAKQLWQNDLYYGKWCKYVIKELECL